MVLARAWYVWGQNLAFPYAEGLLSGPFDGMRDAFAEAKRLRPLYPEANLTAIEHRAKTLPVKIPRRDEGPERAVASYDLSKAAGRREAAEALRTFVADRLGLQCAVEDWDGEPDVDCTAGSLRANIWIGWTARAPMPLISWVAAEGRDLRAVLPGAWRETYPHRKATSEPATWARLFDALEIGLLAGVDGSAFES